jgi:hypothetical protein
MVKPVVIKPATKSIIGKPILQPSAKPIVKTAPKTVKKHVVKSSSQSLSRNLPKSLPQMAKTSVHKKATVKKHLNRPHLGEIDDEHDTYFVYLKTPLEYRRHVLECSRKILFCLKSHQKILLIRQKKLEETRILINTVRELLYLNKKFNEKLPKYDTALIEGAKHEDKKASATVKSLAASSTIPIARKPIETPAEKTEMEKLEESLLNIEKKLKMLQ